MSYVGACTLSTLVHLTSLPQRELNEITRTALTAAAQLWIKEFLPLHFIPSATQRYGYAPRNAKYRAIKRRAEKIRIAEFSNVFVPAPSPPSPLVWTGELKKEVLGRPLSEYNIKARATSNKQQVRVPVKIPHPLNPKNSGEITKLITLEILAMQNEAMKVFRKELEKRQTTKTETIKA